MHTWYISINQSLIYWRKIYTYIHAHIQYINTYYQHQYTFLQSVIPEDFLSTSSEWRLDRVGIVE